MESFIPLFQATIAFCAVFTALGLLFNLLLRPVKENQARLEADITKLDGDIKEVKTDLIEVKTDLIEVKADIKQLIEVKADIKQLIDKQT